MTNYFGSIFLYRWTLKEEDVSKFEEVLPQLSWKIMLIFHLIVSVLIALTSIVFASSLVPEVSSYFILILIYGIFGVLMNVLFLFGGYFFTKAFFNIEMNVFQFYTKLAYLLLPVLTIQLSISLLGIIMSKYLGILGFVYIFPLYLVLLYYFLKEVNTALYLFSKEFNTSQWKIIGVVLLWSIITSFIMNYIELLLLLIFGVGGV